VIRLPRSVLETLEAAARRAFPREACGLLAGRESADDVLVTRMVETENLAPAEAPDRFELDARVHLRLQRDLRGSAEEILGVFHSHPSGRPEPSETDRVQAVYPGWIWLITAVDAAGGCETRAFHHLAQGGFAEEKLEVAHASEGG